MEHADKFSAGIDFAKAMDEKDVLKHFRNEFFNADENTIYLDGNSLGKMSKETKNRIVKALDYEWGERLIRNWNDGWYELSEKISAKIAHVVGAKADEIATGDSTSINLYKTAMAAMRFSKGRKRIVSDELNFPTDIYVLQGVVDQMGSGYELVLTKSKDGIMVSMEELEKVVDENTALVVLSHVAFKSAFMYNMKAVTDFVHSKGALIIWDLSHASGAVPIGLNDAGADMAIGCTYKYLNGGPGSPAFLFVAKKLQNELLSPVWGWFGDENPFAFNLEYKPASGIRRFLVGTPPVLSLSAIEPGLDLILAAGIENLRKKGIRQSDYLIYLWKTMLQPLGFGLGSPMESANRGSHVSLQHPEGYRICKALIEPKDGELIVIPDFRAPDNIRIGIAPIYNSYHDIFNAVQRIQKIVQEKEYLNYSDKKDLVT